MIPTEWRSLVGLWCGFGDRTTQPRLPPGVRLVTTTQVHGCRLIDAKDAVEGADADGIVVTVPRIAAAVRTADCVPILLIAASSCAIDGSRQVEWAAAVHAGWRGTTLDVVGAAVRAATAAGLPADRIEGALGPAIGPCCYRVGEEVAERFRADDLPVTKLGDHPALDLRRINAVLLERAGVPPTNITMHGPCTNCQRDRYHSYRADPADPGRQLSWIGWS